MTELKLKPCPFCGGKAKFADYGQKDEFDAWNIECEKCGILLVAPGKEEGWTTTKEEAAECICDERVNVYRNGEIYDHRPYECPFRYYTDVSPITDRFDGMTKEETKGWFEGAAAEHENYKRLEMERDEYVGSDAYRRLHDDER